MMSTALIESATTQQDVIGSQPLAMSIENPNMDLNDPATYDLLTDGAESEAGVKVTEGRALTHPAVWQAITLISDDVAGLPLEVFRKDDDGDRVMMESDRLYDLVHWQPNDEMTAFVFWKRMMAFRLLWNNAYAWINRNGAGEALAMVPLLPDRTYPMRHNGVLRIVTETNGELIPLHPGNVFHLEGLSIDGLAGFEFIKAARQAIGLGLAQFGFVSKFFKNGGRVGGILELPSNMPKTARDKVEEGFKKRYALNEAFQTIVLRENAKFHQAQVTPEAAQVIDARRESVRDIARFFNVRPGKLAEESKNSFASKAEDNRDHYDTTLRPHLRGITQQCRSKLLTPQQKLERTYFEHNTRDLLKMDFKSMSEAISTLRMAEVINADEARGFVNLNKRDDGRGGDYRNPNINPTPSSESDNQPAGKAIQQSFDRPTAEAFSSLFQSTVDRLAGFVANRAVRIAEDPKEFIRWVEQGREGQRGSVTRAVEEIVVAAQKSGVVPEDFETSVVVEAFLQDSHLVLQSAVINSPNNSNLKSAVQRELASWQEVAGERYSAMVFTK